ncbi:Drug resistance transporter, EmrB/QacA subfamily [Devosia sp. LC5]|uniref:MFS transporter n=1 Tax=Devosia sp. LC5 TaxID=1502724 RepID=UPI0004E2C556|nr:MFS transporter [Devosia sp. LC5]KFC66321.1 Drug resistance transporter, EmrB/QacA subfamily [Devosia sp. LC5]
MSETSSSGSWAEIFSPRYATVTLILCLGVALFAFNAFLASTALPTAVLHLGGIELISWALTLYLVFAIMGGAGAALIKQRLGSRTALLASSAVFLVGTLIASNASTMTEVLIGRSFQGLGEGVVAAICFALIPELFPSRLVPKVFGTQASVWAVAAFGGPLGAGLLTELVSWRAAFLVNVPLVLIFAVMVMFVVPGKSKDADAQSPGFPGIRLLTIGGGIMLVALASIAPPLQATALLIGAALLLAGSVLLDRRSRVRLMPTGAFWPNSVIGSGYWVVLLMPIAGASAAVYLVLLVQQLWGYGPTLAGAIGAVMAVAWSLSAIAVANVRQRETRKMLIRTGPALIALGLLGVLAGLLTSQIAIVLIAQLAIGTGFGVCNGYLNLTLMESASDADRDRTSALLPTTQSAGNAIGAALAGVAANSAGFATAVTAGQIHHAIIPVFVLGAAVAALAFIAALRMTGLAGRQTTQSSFATAR